jgi:hypothetical protein
MTTVGTTAPEAMEKTMFDVNAKLRRTILAGVVAVIPLALAGSAQAYQCKYLKTQAEALGNTVAGTKASARGFWSTAVKNKYHLSWSVWDIAAAKSESCNWTGTKFYCIIKARPWKYVVQ